MSNTSMNLNFERLNRLMPYFPFFSKNANLFSHHTKKSLNEKLNYVSIYNLTIHKNQSINNDFSSY